jgi:phosphoribosylamine-glycine ligase
MKKVMILAGGNDQIALMEEIRRYFKNEVEIILVDMSEKVRAIPYADKFLKISTMDKAAVLKAAREEKIDYILTACGDQPLSTMAYVATEMGLPTYLTEHDVRDLTNKRYMKEKMVQVGIPTAKHIYINKTWDGKLPDWEFPLVVKPVDSNGSKGVKKVFSQADLEKSLKEAFQYSLSGDVIIEEFKQGEELSVDVYVEGTTAKLLSITASKKIQENKDSFTIIQSYYPAPTDYKEEQVLEICQKIVNAWHLHDTPLLVQLIQNEDSYNVLEFSARMGGGSKYRLIQVLSGVDIMKVYVEMVMGQKPKVEPQKQYNNAIMSYVYCYPGIYESIVGLEELKEKGIILDYFIYRGSNSAIEKSNTSSDRVAGFLVVGASKDEVENKLEEANATLCVLNDKGEDIMRHDLFQRTF